eukprot:3407343-Amphidinium_carterae.1
MPWASAIAAGGQPGSSSFPLSLASLQLLWSRKNRNCPCKASTKRRQGNVSLVVFNTVALAGFFQKQCGRVGSLRRRPRKGRNVTAVSRPSGSKSGAEFRFRIEAYVARATLPMEPLGLECCVIILMAFAVDIAQCFTCQHTLSLRIRKITI